MSMSCCWMRGLLKLDASVRSTRACSRSCSACVTCPGAPRSAKLAQPKPYHRKATAVLLTLLEVTSRHHRKPTREPLNERSGNCDVREVEQRSVSAEDRVEIIRRTVDREVSSTSVHVQPAVHEVQLFPEATFRDTDAEPDGEEAIVCDAGGRGATDHCVPR